MYEEYRRRTWESGTDLSLEQTEFAKSHRVPLLSSSEPRWCYITGIVIQHNEFFVTNGIVPTEDEIRMVGSFAEEYRQHWYNDSFRNAMTEFAPYDIDGGANLAYLIKRPEGDWCYRKRTWRMGPRWSGPHGKPGSLVEVLDWVYTHGDDGPMKRWVDWKSAHPEVFAI